MVAFNSLAQRGGLGPREGRGLLRVTQLVVAGPGLEPRHLGRFCPCGAPFTMRSFTGTSQSPRRVFGAGGLMVPALSWH